MYLQICIPIVLLICSVSPVTSEDNVVAQWLQLIIQAQPRVSSGLIHSSAIIAECVYDAWATYHPKAKLIARARSPIQIPNPTAKDIEESISYAAHRAFSETNGYDFPTFQSSIDDLLISLNYPLSLVNNFDLTTPSGIGNDACAKVIQRRNQDGSNRLGDASTATSTERYLDPTFYFPVNDPQLELGRSDCSKLRTINRWSPVVFDIGNQLIVQEFTETHFGQLRGFSFDSARDYLAPPPSLFGTPSSNAFIQKNIELVNISGSLDDRKKAIGEFWGVYLSGSISAAFTVGAIRANNLTVDQSVKLLLLAGEVALDAIIVEMYNKRYYDHTRPMTAVQCLLEGQSIYAWKGPYQGVGWINASHWRPYAPDYVVQFIGSEYISGGTIGVTSTATAFKLYLGNAYNLPPFVIPAGSFLEEPKIDDPSDPRYIAGVTDVPNSGPATVGYAPATDIELTWNTWDELPSSMAQSRNYVGMHYVETVSASKILGERLGESVYRAAVKLFGDESNQCSRERIFQY